MRGQTRQESPSPPSWVRVPTDARARGQARGRDRRRLAVPSPGLGLLTSRGRVHAPLTALEASPAAAAVGLTTSVKVTPFTHAAGACSASAGPAMARYGAQKTKPRIAASAAAAAALRRPGRERPQRARTGGVGGAHVASEGRRRSRQHKSCGSAGQRQAGGLHLLGHGRAHGHGLWPAGEGTAARLSAPARAHGRDPQAGKQWTHLASRSRLGGSRAQRSDSGAGQRGHGGSLRA